MKATLSFLFVPLLFSLQLKAQSTKKVWHFGLNDCRAAIGYLYQGEHVGEAGLKFDLQQTTPKTNRTFSFIPGAQVIRHDKVMYLSPFAMLRYYEPLQKDKAITIAVSYNYRKVQGQICCAITPELGFCFGPLNLSYGYNFFPNDRFSWTWHHRLAIRTMLF